jgi:hypothetical protein
MSDSDATWSISSGPFTLVSYWLARGRKHASHDLSQKIRRAQDLFVTDVYSRTRLGSGNACGTAIEARKPYAAGSLGISNESRLRLDAAQHFAVCK